MQLFKDRHGKDWTVEITIGDVRRVRAATGVDLYRFLEKPVEDLVQTIEVIWHLVRKQAEAKGLAEEDFYDSLSGDSLQRAIDAFQLALVDFFQSASLRENLKTMFQKHKDLQERVMERAKKRLELTDIEQAVKELEKRWDAEIQQESPGPPPKSNGSSGNLPESLESIPSGSPPES